jgi:hypothetical protein
MYGFRPLHSLLEMTVYVISQIWVPKCPKLLLGNCVFFKGQTTPLKCFLHLKMLQSASKYYYLKIPAQVMKIAAEKSGHSKWAV